MKFEDFVQRLEQEIPEIHWEKENRWFNAHYFLATFSLCGCCDKNGNFTDATIPVPFGIANRIEPGIMEEDLDLVLDNINENNIGGIIKAFKDWIENCKNIKAKAAEKGVGEDQIILIHPDCDNYTIPEILKDLKCVIFDQTEGGGIGIMEDKKWNFSDEDLCELLDDNSQGGFGIWPGSRDILEDSSLYNELVKKYPEAKNITKIFMTDWD